LKEIKAKKCGKKRDVFNTSRPRARRTRPTGRVPEGQKTDRTKKANEPRKPMFTIGVSAWNKEGFKRKEIGLGKKKVIRRRSHP